MTWTDLMPWLRAAAGVRIALASISPGEASVLAELALSDPLLALRLLSHQRPTFPLQRTATP